MNGESWGVLVIKVGVAPGEGIVTKEGVDGSEDNDVVEEEEELKDDVNEEELKDEDEE